MQQVELDQARNVNNDLLRQQHDIIPSAELKPFKKRNDSEGLKRITVHLAVIGCTGWLLYLSLGTPWVIPAFVLHGVFLNHLFAPVHECAHGTAFKTRWINETVLWVCGLLTLWPPMYFRWDHAGHHTYAQVQGVDPEQIFPPPRSFLGYLYVLFGGQLLVRNFTWMIRNAAGRIAPFNQQFVPESERSKVHWESRFMLAVYATVIGVSIWLQSWNALILWAAPLLLLSPVARGLRLADHTGCADHTDLRTGSRTTLTDPITQYFCWNMNFHCEHHLASAVPFHQLPGLYEKVGHKLNPTDKGYLAVQWEIVTQHVSGILRRKAV